jgi:pimeloyl-ACP methyl ester carboxylesterase
MTSTATTYTERTNLVAGRKVRLLEGGSGEPVVVLHHSNGNPGWVPFYDRLAEQFRVIVPDLPGYGQSERPEWARDARDIAVLINRLLEKEAFGPVTLIGLGFGGFIAAELATMRQSALKRLVLIGAAGLQPEGGEILDQMLVDFEEYAQAGYRDADTYRRALGEDPATSFKELWDYSREMTARLSWKPYMFSRRLRPVLSEVQTPALVVWGENDQVVPLNCGELYAQSLANARLEVVPEAGHLVEMEEPERVASMIAEFVRKG